LVSSFGMFSITIRFQDYQLIIPRVQIFGNIIDSGKTAVDKSKEKVENTTIV
jgi:hypothetical protein